MIGNELFRLLTNLGEKLTKEEAKGLMKELCEPEDEDGFMPFIPSLRGCAQLRSKMKTSFHFLPETVYNVYQDLEQPNSFIDLTSWLLSSFSSIIHRSSSIQY